MHCSNLFNMFVGFLARFFCHMFDLTFKECQVTVVRSIRLMWRPSGPKTCHDVTRQCTTQHCILLVALFDTQGKAPIQESLLHLHSCEFVARTLTSSYPARTWDGHEQRICLGRWEFAWSIWQDQGSNTITSCHKRMKMQKGSERIRKDFLT